MYFVSLHLYISDDGGLLLKYIHCAMPNIFMLHMCVYVYIYICMYIYMCVYVFMYIHTHILSALSLQYNFF